MAPIRPGSPSPQRITGSRQAWPLLDVSEARSHEAAARAGLAPGALMARAGLAVARLALALAPGARSVAVCCGPGDNGGDGLVAARWLHAAGWRVAVHVVEGQRPMSADRAAALRDMQRVGLQVTPWPEHLQADLLLDALLGLGSTRAPEGEVAAAIARLRHASRPVLAIDIPSGLHPDTGAVLGTAAVVATATLCPLSLRPGCFTGAGRDHAGEVWLDDLGHAAGGSRARLAAAPSGTGRPHASHKGRFGDLIVIGGARGMQGAALLAAEAALAAGCGRVFVCLLDERGAPSWRPELMPRSSAWASEPANLADATVVAGCGGGEDVGPLLPSLLAHAASLVLDADALNALAAQPALMLLLRARARHGLPTLLTPHPLEAARLLGTDAAAVQCNRLQAARQLAQSTGATVLLKGSGSIVAAPGEPLLLNPTGNAALATAGTGDALAGWAAGTWAARAGASAAEIAAGAAWTHGAAADRFALQNPGHALRAHELIEWMLRVC